MKGSYIRRPRNIGNKRLRDIVNEFKEKYQKCSRHEKTALAESLVRNWRNQDPPGRFLKQNHRTGLWDDVGEKARAKISQLLREGAPKTRQSKEEDEETEDRMGPTFSPAEEHVPPPPAHVNETTPPKRKNPKEVEVVSPVSVMDMPFYDVSNDALQTRQRMVKILQGFRIPGLVQEPMPDPHKLQREYNEAQKPASKHRRGASALSTYMTKMLGEKMPGGSQNATIVQDNAATPCASLRKATEEGAKRTSISRQQKHALSKCDS